MTPQERFEILKVELSLIQATIDKYDDLVFRGRNLFSTLWVAIVGIAFTIDSLAMPWLASALSVLYWFLEGTMRHQYSSRYVDRYRFLRESLNAKDPDLSAIPIYDLTNHYRRRGQDRLLRLRESFFRIEPSLLYGIMAIAGVAVWLLLSEGNLEAPGGN